MSADPARALAASPPDLKLGPHFAGGLAPRWGFHRSMLFPFAGAWGWLLDPRCVRHACMSDSACPSFLLLTELTDMAVQPMLVPVSRSNLMPDLASDLQI